MTNNVHGEEVAPGTVRLIDANGELNVKHSEGHGDIVLVPTPSGQQVDPRLPLNIDSLFDRRSRRPPQLDKEAKVVAHCLYGHLYSHVGIPQRCRIFRGEAYLHLDWHIHHDDQQRHWCYVSSLRMVDDLLASSCATVWQATGVFDIFGCFSRGFGGCTDVSIFWDLSGN